MNTSEMTQVICGVLMVLYLFTPLGTLLNIFVSRSYFSVRQYTHRGVFKSYARKKYERLVREQIAKCATPRDACFFGEGLRSVDDEGLRCDARAQQELLSLKDASAATQEDELVKVLSWAPQHGRARQIVLTKLEPIMEHRISMAKNSHELVDMRHLVSAEIRGYWRACFHSLIQKEVLGADNSSTIEAILERESGAFHRELHPLADAKMHALMIQEVLCESQRELLAKLNDRIKHALGD